MEESLEDKKRQRDKFELLVDSDIKATKFNAESHKHFLMFFLGTVVLGAFFMWCSSTTESNFFVLYKEERIKTMVILVITQGPFLCVMYLMFKDILTTRKKFDIEIAQDYIIQRRIFSTFLKQKIKTEGNIKSESEMLNLIKMSTKDISFEYNEFWMFISTYISKNYKFNFPTRFNDHLTNLILYNEELEGTLIKENKRNYTFIIEGNMDFVNRIW